MVTLLGKLEIPVLPPASVASYRQSTDLHKLEETQKEVH